jgi:hypothetical protein
LLSGGVLLGAIAVAYAWSVQLPRLGWHPLSEDLIAALDACPDQLYNRYDEGGYLIWFVRERKVFLDSRQDPFPPDLIHAQIRVERSGDYQRLFDRYSIHCALLPQDSPVAQRLTASGWAAWYQDRGWIVFAH